ncbi:MAG: sugar ABC transporter permease [Christensenellaceae bacterium]|nr:sugar ABC transporter permease [Christensenellaceae bacterium]
MVHKKDFMFYLRTVVLYIVLFIVVLLVLYPILFTLSSAFSDKTSLSQSSPIPFSDPLSTKQFENLFAKTEYLKWYGNTFKIAVMNTIISTVCTTVAAYIFSRFKFRVKKGLLMGMLVLQIFPSFAGMIAVYVLLWRINLLDTHFGLVLIYAAGQLPYNIWLIKGYLDTIPRSLDEAARVDGASYLRTFISVVLPIAKPMVLFLAITSFTGPWMDYIMPRILISTTSKKTLAVGLFEMIKDRANNNFTMFAAGAILVAIPFMIVFAFNQQYLSQVLSAGAVKE